MTDEPESREPTGREADEAAAAEAAAAGGAERDGRETREARGAAPPREPADATAEAEQPFGPLGHPLRRNSPFMVGFLGALGVFLAWFLIQALVQARSVIVLIVVSMFLAVGLNPAVEALARRGMRRSFAVLIVLFCAIGAFVGFGFAVVPPVVDETDAFVQQVPTYLEDLRENPTINRFDQDYDIISKAQAYVSSGELGRQVFGGIVGVGRVVLNAVFGAFSLLILTLYFLAALPSIKRQAYRLVPASRRERVQLLGDEILARVGGFVSGALTVAFIAAVTSYVFLTLLDMPYALALAVFVGLLDLVPLIGATIAAVVVTTIGFIESTVVGMACIAFYIAYQQFENYVIYPRVMRKAVDVPAALTVVAVLLGGALLGVVGALLAIPTAAAVLLIVRQVAIPRMDRV